MLGVGDCVPGGGEPGLVSRGLEHRQRRPGELQKRTEVVGGRVDREHITALLELREQLASTVAGGFCPLGRRGRDRLGFGEPARAEQGVGQIEVEIDTAPLGWKQRGGALEQVDGGAEIVAEKRASSAWQVNCTFQVSWTAVSAPTWPRLDPVPMCLLEVVAHDLVGFDKIGCVRQQPVGEVLVKFARTAFGSPS